MSTTRPLTPLGSTRSSAGSDSLLNRPSAAEASKASRTSSLKSTASPKTTTNTANHSHGPPPQIPSSKNSPDYVIVFPGQHTRMLNGGIMSIATGAFPIQQPKPQLAGQT